MAELTVHILAVETGMQAHAIRAAAEHWGAFVTMTWAGNSAQIVDYFSRSPRQDFIVTAAHGDERGLVLPELGVEVRHLYPFNEVICPDDFAGFLRLRQNVVVNLSCLGGVPPMADAFLKQGANAYIGATDYPDAAASTKYAIDLLYHVCIGGFDLDAAHSLAASRADDCQYFTLYKTSGASQKEKA